MRRAAIFFSLLSVPVMVFQIAVALGAPLGHLTQGGFTEGRLAVGGRIMAAVSSLMTVAMAQIILTHGGVAARRGPLSSRAALWLVLGLLLAGLAMNLMSPSAPERMLWSPVLAALLVSAGIVAVQSFGKSP